MDLRSWRPEVFSGVLSPGVAGTAETLALMTVLAEDGARDLQVRETALKILRDEGVADRDWPGALRAIFEYVRDTIHFVNDIAGVEMLNGPRYTLQQQAGDCDDKAMLLVALLRSIGYPFRLFFKAISTGSNPHVFSHVYVATQFGNQMLGLDPSVGMGLGWEYPGRAMQALHEV